MNILIVDDEYYSVEGIKQKLSESELEICTLFTAYSMDEAKQIIKENRIDILISDIEMPKGSGLELISWVKENKYQTLFIIITSHAEFNYARKALELQTLDYILKPVQTDELISSVEHSIRQVLELERKQLDNTYAQYWNDAQAQTLESFWQKIAIGRIPPSELMIIHELNTLHLSHDVSKSEWLPVFINCIHTEDSKSWEDGLYEYALKNILIESFFKADDTPIIPNVGYRQYLVLLHPKDYETNEVLSEKLNSSMHNCTASLPGIFHFFPAEICNCMNLGEVCRKLQQTAKDTIYAENLIFNPQTLPENHYSADSPDWEKWSDMLLSQKSGEVESEALKYLASLGNNLGFQRKDLNIFYHDFLQMIYGFLAKSGSYAHILFKHKETEVLSESACDSIDKMSQWVKHIIASSLECISSAQKTTDTISSVKAYIEEHISEELDRNILAGHVFISPDYLSHLFSEREGVSLTSYIVSQRISYAKQLLYRQNLSVRDVALGSGFQNISYFSKIFKRETGMTPQEFKKKIAV